MASFNEREEPSRSESGTAYGRAVILAVVMMGTAVTCVSQSMMVAALPAVMREYAIDAALGQLLTSSYSLVLGITAAMTAFLMANMNSRKLFLASMVCFVVGCALALFAPNYGVLFVGRLLQAVGSGVLSPFVSVVALSLYPKSEYGKAVGIVGLIIGFAPAIGPVLSGVMVDTWGWRSIFTALSCVSVAVIAVAVPVLKGFSYSDSSCGRFDAPSGLLYALGFSAVMVGISLAESGSASVPLAIVAFAIGGMGLAVFVRRQLRIENPLLKLSCFFDRTFAVSAVFVVVSQMAFMVGNIMVPLFVQEVQGASATVSGLIILPGAIVLGILNPLAGRALDRYGVKALIPLGTAVMTLGSFAFLLCTASTPGWVVTVLYGIRMAGIACIMMPMTAYACIELEHDDIAHGSSILSTFRQIGGAIMVSAMVSLMAVASNNATGVSEFGFDASFVLFAVLSGAALVISFIVLPKHATAA